MYNIPQTLGVMAIAIATSTLMASPAAAQTVPPTYEFGGNPYDSGDDGSGYDDPYGLGAGYGDPYDDGSGDDPYDNGQDQYGLGGNSAYIVTCRTTEIRFVPNTSSLICQAQSRYYCEVFCEGGRALRWWEDWHIVEAWEGFPDGPTAPEITFPISYCEAPFDSSDAPFNDRGVSTCDPDDEPYPYDEDEGEDDDEDGIGDESTGTGSGDPVDPLEPHWLCWEVDGTGAGTVVDDIPVDDDYGIMCGWVYY